LFSDTETIVSCWFYLWFAGIETFYTVGLQILGCKSKEPVAESPAADPLSNEDNRDNSDALEAAVAKGKENDASNEGDVIEGRKVSV